jgi:hypothetical protein
MLFLQDGGEQNMIKLIGSFAAITVPSYVVAAVIAQATHTDVVTIYSVGIFGGVVIAAMRLQRVEDKIQNLWCQKDEHIRQVESGEICPGIIKKLLDRLGLRKESKL